MKLSTLFSDGAVLQRGMPIPVWGTTKPQSHVRIRIGDSSAQGFASTDGDFLIRVPEVPAGGPYTIVAENISTGEKTEVNDVLVGEVWLASGQSNMEFKMSDSPAQMRDFNALNVDPSTLRMFTVKKCASTARLKNPEGAWFKSTPDYACVFSAVAAWFAQKLREKLNVPVGIIHSSWGGTFIEAWTSRSTLMRNPGVRDLILALDKKLATSDVWAKNTAEFVSGMSANKEIFEKYGIKDPGNTGLGKGWADVGFNDSAWKNFEVPGAWTYQKIAGNGIVWARFSVEIPERWNGKKLQLHLGGVDKQDITYFNGTEVGRTGKDWEDAFWCVPRNYTVPAELAKPGKAVIAVRAYSFIYDGALNGADEFYYLAPADDPADKISLAGIWKAEPEADFGIVRVNFIEHSQGPNFANTYSILFDAMIRPLVPYAMRGAIWYQGESNASSIESSQAYERLMKDMINDWRFFWEQGDFPFYMVQLANFRTPKKYEAESTWGHLRESQRLACKTNPNTGMAVTTDCGDVLDIHPKDKRTVGERLAAAALHDTYFINEPAGGPLPLEARKENGGIRILFSNTDGGLVFRSECADAFRLANTDGNFKIADSVVIEGNSLFVKSSEVEFPIRVRYNWADCPLGTLYNGAGFPATSFEIG